MNRLKSIIVLRIYVYAGRYSRPKEGRERERGRGRARIIRFVRMRLASFQCKNGSSGGKKKEEEKKKKKENTISRSLSTGSLRFLFFTLPVRQLLAVRHPSSCVVHLFNITVSHVKKTSITQLCSKHISIFDCDDRQGIQIWKNDCVLLLLLLLFFL